jgi:hypothetical protein
VPTTLGDTLKFRIIIGYDDLHVMQSCRKPRLPPQRYIHRETALTDFHENECLCIYYISKYTKTQALFAYSAANSPKKFMMTKKSQKALDLR